MVVLSNLKNYRIAVKKRKRVDQWGQTHYCPINENEALKGSEPNGTYLMTNHVHLLVTPEDEKGISRLMQTLGRHYVRYFNYSYKRTGTLWEGRFKSCVVDEENYLLLCQRYIEMNPVRANMVAAPGEYKWSSYQANGLGKSIKLWTPHKVYKRLGASTKERTHAYRELFRGHIDESILHEIRIATHQGMVLGSERFKEEVKQLSGRRVKPLKRGPKRKHKSAEEFLL